MIERLPSGNLARWEARLMQKRLEKLGSCSRIIGNNLDRVFPESLLGLRQGCKVDQAVLTPRERELLKKGWLGAVVIDYDGVIAEPTKAVALFVQNPGYWRAGFEGLKQLGKVPPQRWKWLEKVAEAAHRALLHTSRCWSLSRAPSWWKLLAPLERQGCYPFLGPEARERLQAITKRSGLEVITGKPFWVRDKDLDRLRKIVTRFDITYFVGSGHFDRRRVWRLVKRDRELAEKIVFFDTCCLLL